jgi:hypothetical protein
MPVLTLHSMEEIGLKKVKLPTKTFASFSTNLLFYNAEQRS